MSWSNAIFDVNGRDDEDLLKTLKLVFDFHGRGGATHFIDHPEKGLILLWSESPKSHRLPGTLNAEAAFPIILSYLASENASAVPHGDWEGNLDHDGTNRPGWRVYVENWGHVGDCYYTICAIKKVWIWYGK